MAVPSHCIPAPVPGRQDLLFMFLLSDELFVSEAYLQLLGRPADAEGYLVYTRALRKGLSRVRLLLELQRSDEARSLVARRWPQHVAPELWPRYLPKPMNGLRRSTTQELLELEGAPFVDAACGLMLGTPPPEEDRADWERRSEAAEDRRELLRLIRRRMPMLHWPWPRATAAHAPSSERYADRGLQALADHAAAAARCPPAESSTRHVVRTTTGTAVFTVATLSYLPFVRVLMRSLRAVHPDWHQYLLLVDEVDPTLIDEGWTTVLARDIGLANFDDLVWRYDVVELCTALKPMFMRWMFDHTELRDVIYLDPDIRLFAPMRALESALNGGAPMVLTPHITEPLVGDGEPTDHSVLKSGVFNLGFAAVRRGAEALAFVDWWADRMRTQALVDFKNNLFTDQRWCDLAPGFVPGLAVLRDHAYNAAYWNLGQRRFSRVHGHWNVDGAALVFYHFSGFDPDQPTTVSKYQTRLDWQQIEPLQPLYLDYAAELHSAGWASAKPLPYAYGAVDEVRLTPSLRRLYRELHPQTASISRRAALQQIADLCATDAEPGTTRRQRLSPLMRRLHAQHTVLQRTFDLSTTRGETEFEGWFWSTGIVEHGLTDLVAHAAAHQRNGRDGLAA